MSQLNTTSFKNLYGTSGTEFPDNTTQEISEGDMRTFGENIADSFLNKSENPVVTVKSTDAQTAGNTGSGEDTLFGYVVSANMLASNGDSIHATIFGSFASNINTKNVKAYFGSTLIASFTYSSSGGSWVLDIDIVRTGSATQLINVRRIMPGGVQTTFTAATEDTTSAKTLLVTGEGVSDNDIVKRCAKIRFEPAGSYQS